MSRTSRSWSAAGPQRGGLQAVADGVDVVALALERADERQADAPSSSATAGAATAAIVGPGAARPGLTKFCLGGTS